MRRLSLQNLPLPRPSHRLLRELKPGLPRQRRCREPGWLPPKRVRRHASTSIPRTGQGPTSWSTSSNRWAFEYVAANPGSSFRGLQESFINYGGNKTPELLTCCHEESSVAMAHGYAKIEGKPMMIMAHGTVGLQHASMAIYNAYADRVPVYIVLGNILDGTFRRSDVEWAHSVQDAAAMVRDYTKWDDTPVSLGALRRVRRSRLQDRDDAAHGTGGDGGRRGLQEEPDHREDRPRLRDS